MTGAGDRIRTCDLLITNQLLYQLSYTSISNVKLLYSSIFYLSPVVAYGYVGLRRFCLPVDAWRLHRVLPAAARRSLVLAVRLKAGADWSGKRDSNPQPTAWKAVALPIELFPPSCCASLTYYGGQARFYKEANNFKRLYTLFLHHSFTTACGP